MANYQCCCGCMHVKTGAVVIGVITLIWGLLSIVSAFTLQAYKPEDTTTSPIAPSPAPGDGEAVHVGVRWGTAVVFAAWALAGLLILVGRYAHNHLLYLPYLILNGVVIACTVVGLVFCVIFFIFGGFLILPIAAIQLLLVIWFEWIVYKAYQWTKDGEDMPQSVTYTANNQQRQQWA